jgi:hypothetical protein
MLAKVGATDRLRRWAYTETVRSPVQRVPPALLGIAPQGVLTISGGYLGLAGTQ